MRKDDDIHFGLHALHTRPRNANGRWLAVLALVVAAGGVASYWAGRSAERSAREVILDRAATAAAAVNPAHIMALAGSEADLSNPDYLRIKEQLTALRQASNEIRFYYLLRSEEGHVVLLCDSEAPDSKDYSPPGQAYEEADPAFARVLAGNGADVAGPTRDRWGVWVSGIVPVFSADGRLIAAMGADIDARDWRRRIALARSGPLIIMSLLCALLLLLWLSRRRDKAAKEELRQSAERFRHSFDLSPVGCLMMSRALDILRVNDAFCQFVGFEKAELEGRRYGAFIHPEDVEADGAELQAMIEGGATWLQRERRWVRKDGAIAWGHVSYRLVRAENGGPAYFLPVIVNVTERKRAEEALRQHMAFNTLITQLLAQLASCSAEEIDAHILASIEQVGLLVGVDEVFVVVASRDGATYSATHHWHKPGKPDLAEHFRCIPRSTYAWTERQVRQGEIIQLNAIEDLPDEATFERRVYEAEGVKAMLEAPLLGRAGVVAGCLGFRSFTRQIQWTEDEKKWLRMLGDAIANVLERKRAEEELAASERRFAGAFHSNAALMAITTRDEGRFVDVNESFLRAFGYTREEVIGKIPPDLGLYDDPGQRAAILRALDERGSARDVEAFGRGRLGNLMYGFLSVNIFDVQGVPHLLTVMHDATARRRAEMELRETRDYLDKLIDHASAPIIVWDPAMHITRFNHAFERLTGYGAQDVLGRDLGILFAENTRAESLRKIESAIGGEHWEAVEIPVRRADGSQRVALWNSANILDDEGKTVLATIAQGIDITERVHLEEQLAQSQKMESIGRLAGGVAHDFNNILTVILGYSDLLLESLSKDSPLRPTVADILSAGVRARDLTRQLLAFSRKQVLETRNLDLNEVVQGMENMIRRLLGEDIEVRVNAKADIGLVCADPSQIEQVLMNLCVNARDAMPRGGILTIETGAVILDDHYAASHDGVAPGAYVMLSVSDTGVGMDEETRRRIFDPFFTTKEMGKGTGLGLATVFGTVKQHGGSIWVYSEPGHGSTFKIHLPQVREGAVDLAPEEGSATIAGNGEVVLVMEDEPPVRRLTCQMLRRLGYTVIEAESTEHCLEVARGAERVDLLLTDVIMPVMDGKRLYDRVAEIRPALRALFMSGYTEDVIGQHGVLKKGVHFISKPFTERGLSRRVHEALRG